MKRISIAEEAVTTLLWTGYFPIAPATVASALTCLIFWFPSEDFLKSIWTILAIPVLAMLGVWLSNRYIEHYEVPENHRFKKLRRPNPKKGDPDPVVFDEFIGQWITLIAVPHTVLGFTAAFFIFRFLDIFKPLGINRTQTLAGGWGVMVDDVLAGIAGAALIFAVLFFAPNLLG